MTEYRVPGLALALIESGRIVRVQGFGVKEPYTQIPVTSDTVFELASLSKPTFAYAVLQLVDKGILNLEAPLARYLREPFIPDEPRLPSITARMILSHTSGLPHGRSGNAPIRLLSDPGKRFRYSATGFDYLQSAVRELTKLSLESWIKRSLLDPFDMRDTNFGWLDKYAGQITPAYNAKGEAGKTFNEKYRTASGQWREAVARSNPELSYPSAAAGMYGTARDFARLLIETAAPRSISSAHISDNLLDEMLRPQIKVTNEVSWGLGWGILHTKNDRAIWHWGNWNGLYQHLAVILKNEKKGIVVLTNSGNGLNLCKRLVPQMIDLDIQPLYRFFD